MKKTVDVIIPAYNAGKFIKRTLKSVVLQTYLPEKIIVIDDGSTDDTVSKVNSFKKYSEIEILLIKQANRGPNSARNAGIKNSTSEFIAFLDADDCWKKEKIEKQMKVFQNSVYKNLGIVFCGYNLVDENGKRIDREIISPNLKGDVFNKLLKANLVSGSPSTVLIKRNVLETVGLFDESLRGSEDWDMWLKIAGAFEYDYVSEQLIYVAELNESNSKNYQKMLINRIFFINKWISDIAANEDIAKYHRDKLISGAIFCKIKTPSFKIYETIEKYISPDVKELLFNGKVSIFKAIISNLIRLLKELL